MRTPDTGTGLSPSQCDLIFAETSFPIGSHFEALLAVSLGATACPLVLPEPRVTVTSELSLQEVPMT